MNIHELSDLDADALTIATRGTRTWVTCTTDGEEVTVGPFPTQKLTSALPRHTDDMDGGVAAALIEKEAEPDEGAHIGPEGEVDWHGLYLSENRRAEQAEKERDGALRLAKSAADQADEALGMVARGECHDCIRDAAVIREPLTPEVTDEMLERACRALHGWPEYNGVPWEKLTGWERDLTRKTVRRALAAALTEPPARPEGAEELDGHVDASLRGVGLHPLTAEELRTVADNLASEGVRVVGSES